MRIGTYPTPVQRLPDALGPGRDLWVKRDDLTSPRYGGNKVRKLERVLDVVVARGARRIVTVGGAGSHHVLATAIYAADVGVEVEAVLVPQPWTPHVADDLRAIYARCRVFPARSFGHAAAIVVDRVACGALYVPPGGSTRAATLGYGDATRERQGQIARGELPAPKVIVVTLGSGGTSAGIAAGFAALGDPVRVRGIVVAEPAAWVSRRARRLAAVGVRDLASSTALQTLRLEIDDRYLGPGYGHATAEGQSALDHAARYGLTLDTTYTAKSFAAARDLPPSDDPVLFWHTLSSAPMAPLLEGAPAERDLPADVQALLLGAASPT